MTTGTPLSKVYAGIIPCDRIFFTRFMWASPFDRFPYFEETMFVECLLKASSRRPLKAGHKGLLLDAARLFVAVMDPLARRFYAGYGGTTDWSDCDLEALAVEIAEHFTGDPMVKRKADAALKAIRNQLYSAEIPENNIFNEFVVFDGETKIINDVQIVFDASLKDNNESPTDTFIRTLDYIDHLRGFSGYSSLYALKRDLTGYLRVCHCIFGINY